MVFCEEPKRVLGAVHFFTTTVYKTVACSFSQFTLIMSLVALSINSWAHEAEWSAGIGRLKWQATAGTLHSHFAVMCLNKSSCAKKFLQRSGALILLLHHIVQWLYMTIPSFQFVQQPLLLHNESLFNSYLSLLNIRLEVDDIRHLQMVFLHNQSRLKF